MSSEEGVKTPRATAETTVLDSDAISEAELRRDAERVIQDHVLLAIVSGFIPSPAIDMVAAFTVQMTMLKRLANVYGLTFREDAAKSTVTSLLGTIGGVGAAGVASASFLKSIPVVGTLVGVAGTALSFGAFTYAIGKVFQRHFELGGDFVDLNWRAYQDYFQEMRHRGRNYAREQRREAEFAAVRRRRTVSRAAPVESGT